MRQRMNTILSLIATTKTTSMTSGANWEDLINQILNQMTATVAFKTSYPSKTTTVSSKTDNWQSVLNDIVNQIQKQTGSSTEPTDLSTMDIETCVNTIIEIVKQINEELPDGDVVFDESEAERMAMQTSKPKDSNQSPNDQNNLNSIVSHILNNLKNNNYY